MTLRTLPPLLLLAIFATLAVTSMAQKSITGDEVTASRGPDIGTPVVTRGVAELYGAEAEIGAEEPE